MKNVELRVWEQVEGKPGMVRVKRTRTPNEIAKDLEQQIPDDIKRLFDYLAASLIPGDDPIPDFAEPIVDWRPGGNEGYYVHLRILTRERELETLWTAKTFSREAALQMYLVVNSLIWNMPSMIEVAENRRLTDETGYETI